MTDEDRFYEPSTPEERLQGFARWETNELNTRVTEMILYAEKLDDLKVRTIDAQGADYLARRKKYAVEAREAWMGVSVVEEVLALRFPSGHAEARIAMRGAVEAARKAGDVARAKNLAARFGLRE